MHGNEHRYPTADAWAFGLSTVYVFDVFVHVLFAVLGVLGGECVLLEDGKALLELGGDELLSFVAGVPSVVAEARISSAVKHIDVAGEALTLAVVDRTRTDASLYNYFGPTETAVYVTGKEVVRAELPHRLTSIVSTHEQRQD